MPKEVTASSFCDVCGFDVVADHLGESVRGEGLEEVGEEHGAAVGFSDEVGTDFIEVTTYPLQGSISDGGHAVFLAFALADHDGAALFVGVVDLEVHQLHTTHACAVEDFEHGSITDAKRVFEVGHAHDFFGFSLGEDVLG